MADLETLLDNYYSIMQNQLLNSYHAPKYPADYVIDENQTVKWNREEVKRRNNEREEARKAYYCRLSDAESVIKKYLFEDSNLSQGQFNLIWNKAYDDSHHLGMRSVCETFEELAELYEELRNLEEK